MNKADIKQIIASQGLIARFTDFSMYSAAKSPAYVYAYSKDKAKSWRCLGRLAAIAQMSELDLVQLVKSRFGESEVTL